MTFVEFRVTVLLKGGNELRTATFSYKPDAEEYARKYMESDELPGIVKFYEIEKPDAREIWLY
jgi:hypothetical protein